MFRRTVLSIALVLFLVNTAMTKEHAAPTALEQLRTELAQLQSDSLLGWPAKVLYENFAVVQNEIDKGNRLLRKHAYQISVISVALDSSQVGDCRGLQEREATVLDALDKNAITWIGLPDTMMMKSATDVRGFPLESGDLYPFIQKFHAVPVEHFAPGRYRDIQLLLDAVQARQHIARTAIVLDMHHATSAAIIGPPEFARTVWRVLQWTAPDDAGFYIPVDTGEVFYANPPRK